MFLDLSPKIGSPKPNNDKRMIDIFSTRNRNFQNSYLALCLFKKKRDNHETQQAKFCFWLSVWLEINGKKRICRLGKIK